MLWTRDEFGNLHLVQHISFEPCEDQEAPDLYCLYVNGHCASRPYLLGEIKEVLTDAVEKIQEGLRFLDLDRIIIKVRPDFKAPLREGMQPWPPQETNPEKLH